MLEINSGESSTLATIRPMMHLREQICRIHRSVMYDFPIYSHHSTQPIPMNYLPKTHQPLFIALVYLLNAACLVADEGNPRHEAEQALSLSELPIPCQNLLQNLAIDAQPEEIEKERKKGTILYEAEFFVDGREIEVEMTEDGYLLVLEEQIALDQTPQAVKNAIDRRSEEGRAIRITAVTKVIYEVEIEGRRNKQVFDASGRNLRPSKSIERDDD